MRVEDGDWWWWIGAGACWWRVVFDGRWCIEFPGWESSLFLVYKARISIRFLPEFELAVLRFVLLPFYILSASCLLLFMLRSSWHPDLVWLNSCVAADLVFTPRS
ncbi:hypothetical protein Droror1_Dr00005553 [Drosera rotundifolia]